MVSLLAACLRFIQRRLNLLFFFVMACCWVATALIWYFALFDDLWVRVLTSLVVLLMPMVEFQPPPRTRARWETLIWFLLFVVLTGLLGASNKFGWTGVAANVALLLVALLYGGLIRKQLRRNWLLLTGLILALAVAMVFWIESLDGNENWLSVLLVPLPVVLVPGVAWIPLARRVLESAERRKNCRVGGPGMRAAAMAILFLPVILVAIAVPGMLGLGPTWSAVSLTLAGVLLSALISDPLRNFLLEWGNLLPDR